MWAKAAVFSRRISRRWWASGAVVVVERDLPPGQAADAVEQAGVVGLDLGDVVGTALAEAGAVGVLGVQGVGADDRAGQVDAVQQGLEGGLRHSHDHRDRACIALAPRPNRDVHPNSGVIEGFAVGVVGVV